MLRLMNRLGLVVALAGTVAALAVLLTAAVSAHDDDNLITNGSFEAGTLINTATFDTLSTGSTAIPGWTVSGSIDYIQGFWEASDGVRSLDMTGSSAGSVGQSFPTVIGAVYEVEFDMAGNFFTGCGDPLIKTLRVIVAGVTQDFTFDSAGNTLDDMGWEDEELEFTATSATTTLTFTSLNSGCAGPTLDNVSVELEEELEVED